MEQRTVDGQHPLHPWALAPQRGQVLWPLDHGCSSFAPRSPFTWNGIAQTDRGQAPAGSLAMDHLVPCDVRDTDTDGVGALALLVPGIRAPKIVREGSRQPLRRGKNRHNRPTTLTKPKRYHPHLLLHFTRIRLQNQR